MALSVTPQDVRMGKTFTRDCKTVEEGVLNLTNLIPQNIKKGVNIDGVIGSYNASGKELFMFNHKNFLRSIPKVTDKKLLKVDSLTFRPNMIFFMCNYSQYYGGTPIFMYSEIYNPLQLPQRAVYQPMLVIKNTEAASHLFMYTSMTHDEFKVNDDGFEMLVNINNLVRFESITGFCF